MKAATSGACRLLLALLCLSACTAQQQNYWCRMLQNYYGTRLEASGCSPAWTSTGSTCVSQQSQFKNNLSMFGCPFALAQVPCNTQAGNRCLPEAWRCTVSSTGACPTGNKCCAPPNGQCDCRNRQSCLLPAECQGVQGAVVVADKACYAAPTRNYYCCQEPVCNAQAGDRCLPDFYTCNTSSSGPCDAGFQCCASPLGACGSDAVNGSMQACKSRSQCLMDGGDIVADYTCADASTVCCQAPPVLITTTTTTTTTPPPPPCGSTSNGDHCVTDTSNYVCTASAVGGSCPTGDKCCRAPFWPCISTIPGRWCRDATECVGTFQSGGRVLVDATCVDSPASFVCCQQEPTAPACSGAGLSCKSVTECQQAGGTLDRTKFCGDGPETCCAA